MHTEIDYDQSEHSFSEKYLVHASLYGTSVPDFDTDTFFREMWFTDCSCGWRNGHCGISQTLTGTTIAGFVGCVCSSIDTGWYSGSFGSMVVSFRE